MKLHGQKYLALLALIPYFSFAQCNIVATVFDSSICQQEIDNYIRNDIFLNQKNSANVRKSTLIHLIKNIAADNLLTQYNYLPTETEIDTHIMFSEKLQNSFQHENSQLITTIEFLLENFQYSKVNKTKLKSALASYKRSELINLERVEIETEENEDTTKRDASAQKKHLAYERKMNSKMVSRWKMNKALFNKYGGRVAFQQAGIEPIDAYQKFLTDIQSEGLLEIHDIAY